MSASPFRAGGALTDEHAPVYMERQADRDVLMHLRAMDYLLVIEPRQQGKSSLINHLICHPALNDMAFAYLDVTTPDRSIEATWYQTLCPRILRQLRSFVPRNQWPAIPQTSAGWREFLCDIALFAADAQRRLVIALDEIGAVTFPGATDFFSVLRDVYNSRQAETEFKYLTFLLAGAFHPRDLIQDDKISPFNIAQRVRLLDFTLAQVRELVGKGIWTGGQADALAKRIYYWTNGQPYLTQLLCSYLEATATPADVDVGIERLRREDENHLPPLLDRLKKDEKLSQYVQRIMSGERMKFYPQEHRRQADLELLGVIKVDAEGCCSIRNHICEGILMPGVSLRIEIEANPPPSEMPTIWKRLIVTNQTGKVVTGCEACLLGVEYLDKAMDCTGDQLLGPESQWLSWVPSQFDRISLKPGESKELDLVWWWRSPDGRTDPYLRIASASQLGIERQVGESDLIKIHKIGWYLIRITIKSNELQTIEKRYLLFWSGAQSGSIYIEERALPEPLPPTVTVRPGPEKPVPHSELTSALSHNGLSLFIGSDLPREITSLPSRADLARDLARRKGLDESLALSEVAQRVSQAGNRWEFTDFIRNALDTTGKSPQLFHQRVVDLVKAHQIETLITTAYDGMLELAFQQAGVGINRVVRGSDVSFINSNRPTLIKLYGDAQQPETLVVTDRDHSDLLRDREREPLIEEVRRAFRRNTVLFLGYNLADPDFRFLFDQIAESRFARTAYAVWSGLPEVDVRMWRDRGIVILDTDPLGILGQAQIAAPPIRSEPVINSPVSQSSVGGKDMDHKRGFQALKECLERTGAEIQSELATLEQRFLKNEWAERTFGGSENTRNERAQIVFALNQLALKHCRISFNDLCLDKRPTSRIQSATVDNDEAQARLRRIEAKLDQAIAEDRQSADQILDAIVHNRVEQAEAAQMVADLRSWAQSVQQTGASLNPDVRTAVDTLSQHTGSAYEYLQLAIPIIPGILSYNVELGTQHQLDLKALWGRIKARLGKKGAKGDADPTAGATQVLNTGKAWAVLVGVNQYTDPSIASLSVCVDDVTAIQTSLGGRYQLARLLTDATPDHLPTRSNILGELSAAAQVASEEDLLLFYFSGHGVARDGESYLLPCDTRMSALELTAVAMRDVRKIIEQSPAHAKVIILDACHSGASIGKSEPTMTPEFIRRVFEEAEGMAVLASCKENQQSWEWPEQGCSVFTHYLLEALSGKADLDKKGFVTVSDANRHVTDGVKTWAADKGTPQTPTLQYTVVGDIILLRYQETTD